MCGINGFNWDNKKITNVMNDSLKHRGPDDEGIFTDSKISLGFRRLAIIDLSKKGNQPMKYSHNGKNSIIVFNGEIYNFKEIREELEGKNYKFKSNSDTEVILASYMEWGFDCVNHFNGMWAFCIYDLKKNIFFLSRDRLGQKPLYYYFDGHNFIFSSEIKGILEHKIKLEFDNNAIDLYFAMGFIPAPYSIYKNIYKMEANTNLIFDLKTKKTKKQNYWKPKNYSPVFNKQELKKEFSNILADATKKRLISDVPVGAFLSGGLDSSTIVSEIKKIKGNEKIITYSIGFRGESDETPLMKILANDFVLKNNHSYFEDSKIDEISKKIHYYYDEPFADMSMFPSFFLSNKARNELTVCLSGDGGDEVFGGYGPHKIAAQIAFLKKTPLLLRKFLLKILPKKGKLNKLRTGVYLSVIDPEEIRSEARMDDYVPEIFKKISKEKFRECLKKADNDLVEAFVYYDRYFKTMGDNYLCKVDRASMANSLEVRSPFLDYRFMEFASKIPSNWKANIFGTKIFMRELIKENIPKEILKAKKKGFTPSVQKWVKTPENQKKLRTALKFLRDRKILSEGWINYYEKILKEEGKDDYKARLLLFYDWFLFWEGKVEFSI